MRQSDKLIAANDGFRSSNVCIAPESVSDSNVGGMLKVLPSHQRWFYAHLPE